MYIQTTNTQNIKSVKGSLLPQAQWLLMLFPCLFNLNSSELKSPFSSLPLTKMQTSSSSDLIMFHNILFKLFPQYVAFLYKTYFGISVELHENIRKQLQQKTQKSPKSDLRCPERQIQHIALGVLEEVLEEVNLNDLSSSW